jgi:hypothetical protein
MHVHDVAEQACKRVPVPRFFFNLFDDMTSMDEEGKELPSVHHAHAEAVSSAREMACAEVMHGHLHLSHRIEVAEADGSIVDTVWFRDVVDVGD